MSFKNSKIIKIWSDLSIEVRASLAIMVANFFQSGMKLLFIPVYTRLLSTTEYGVITVFESIQNTLGTITMMTLWASVYNRGMQEFKTDRNRFTASLLFLGNIFTVTVGLVFLFFHNQIIPYFSLTNILWVTMFANFIFMPAYNFWIARQKFEYNYQKMLAMTVVVNVLSPIFAVALILSPFPDKSAAKILGSEIILMAAYIPIFISVFKNSDWKIKGSYLKYGLKFNVPLIPHYASQQILSSCDRIMISYMIDEASAGIYGLSYQIATVVHLVWTSVNAVLIPWTFNKIEEDKIEAIRRQTRNLIIIHSAICVGIMFVAPEVVRIFAPSGYYEGIYIIAPVIGGEFFIALFNLFANVEFYYKKTLYVMMASTIAAVLNIILNAVFIPVFGYQAAAYTTLVCYCIYALMHAINLVRLKAAHYYDMKTIAKLSLAMILVSLIIAHTYDGFLIRYSLLAVIILIVFIKRNIIIEALLTLKKKG
ncbi:MAG: oligosaccharide flippase family protein [Lachnospiraceae bacterium]|nr:oligosaccharide flippase family protein [Lachnospiraceae bacterium]